MKKNGLPRIRTGQIRAPLSREEFGQRFRARFYDPAFTPERPAIERLEEIAWDAHQHSRKAPVRIKAGPDFADPNFELSVEWLATRTRLQAAQLRWRDASTPSRVLVVCGSDRNDGTCPGEMSKSWRLAEIARDTLQRAGMDTDMLDLSLVTSEYGRTIHPCKGCVATAMPLCHWPCSCYPNHALGQVDDWMAEIYERWVAAHAVMLVTPTYWYQSPSVLKLMIDRLVCADGGNPDPTTTRSKTVELAKRIERSGWSYPKHLAGRVYGLIVHGDVAGVESQRRNLSDWLEWMGLVSAGKIAQLERYVGYYEPYFNSHETLDRDSAFQAEVRNAATGVAAAVRELRAGRLAAPVAPLENPRPK